MLSFVLCRSAGPSAAQRFGLSLGVACSSLCDSSSISFFFFLEFAAEERGGEGKPI